MFIFNEEVGIREIPKKIKPISNDRVRFEATIQTVNDINRNNRRYSKQLIEDGLKEVNPRIKGGEFLGELDHPIDQNPVRQLTVLYKDVCHRIVETWWDGNKLNATIETLRTPNGMILKNLAQDGIPVGFSFRGSGEVRKVIHENNYITEVVGPLKVITWDSVSQPSHKEAKLIKLTESVNIQLNESFMLDMSSIKENNGMIHIDGYGDIFYPNDFDNLVERRLITLRNKYQF